MISWGLVTSLVLMPVLLSIFGPLVCTIGPRVTQSQLLAARKQEKLTKIFSPPQLLEHENEKPLVDDENNDDSSADNENNDDHSLAYSSESDDIKSTHEEM
jgi:hypothetical protein